MSEYLMDDHIDEDAEELEAKKLEFYTLQSKVRAELSQWTALSSELAQLEEQNAQLRKDIYLQRNPLLEAHFNEDEDFTEETTAGSMNRRISALASNASASTRNILAAPTFTSIAEADEDKEQGSRIAPVEEEDDLEIESSKMGVTMSSLPNSLPNSLPPSSLLSSFPGPSSFGGMLSGSLQDPNLNPLARFNTFDQLSRTATMNPSPLGASSSSANNSPASLNHSRHISGGDDSASEHSQKSNRSHYHKRTFSTLSSYTRRRASELLRDSVVSITPENLEFLRQRIRAETECFLSASNAHLRDKLKKLLRARKKLVLDTSELTKQEKASVLYILGSEKVDESQYKNAGGHPLTLRRKLTELSSDWERINEVNATRNSATADSIEQTERIVTHLNLNRGLFAESQELAERTGVIHLTDAFENIGFETKPELPLPANADGEEPSAGPSSGVYPFDVPDSDENIIVETNKSGRFQIKAATLDKLVERVTSEYNVDLNTRFVFLLTYHSFTTARELLKKLAARYNTPIPNNMTPAEIQQYKQSKLDRIQIRVCAVLKNWLDEHYSDFGDDPELMAQLQEMTVRMLETSASPLSTQLAKALQQLIHKREVKGAKTAVVRADRCPRVLWSGASTDVLTGQLDIESVHPLEIARQLTLMDFEKFRMIRPRECLDKSWSKKDKHLRAPNIVAMTDQWEGVCGWVTNAVLKRDDVTKRAQVFKRMVLIAWHCRELNNFHSAFAIYCALASTPVFRLKKTKELVPASYLERLDKLRSLFSQDRNSKAIRIMLQNSLTPLIPYLGLFLQDLTFIEDGNQDMTKNMINFDKRSKLAERIRWIKQFQQESYQLQPVPMIQDYLVANLKKADEAQAYKLSLVLEPREAQ